MKSGIYDINGEDIYPKKINIITPEMYGAIGDGNVNDRTAIQNAVANGGFILFSVGKKYKIDNVISLVANTIIDLNGSEIACTNKHMFFNFLGSDTFQ